MADEIAVYMIYDLLPMCTGFELILDVIVYDVNDCFFRQTNALPTLWLGLISNCLLCAEEPLNLANL